MQSKSSCMSVKTHPSLQLADEKNTDILRNSPYKQFFVVVVVAFSYSVFSNF